MKYLSVFWKSNGIAIFICLVLSGCYSVKKLNNPSWYQGGNKSKNYFEGWYFKNVSADKKDAYSVILGASYPKKSKNSGVGQEPHSFIQIINGSTAETKYFRFPITDFSYSRHGFGAKINNNEISLSGLKLNILTASDTITGNIVYKNPVEYRQTFGIMSWLRLLPKMECYHGLVSLNHNIVSGDLTLDSKKVNFSDGKGYIEKDWGSSMPSSWVWVQCNSFAKDTKTSIVISLAKVPYLGGYRRGYFAVLYNAGAVHRFAAYDAFSKVNSFTVGKDHIRLQFQNRTHTLEVLVSRTKTGTLKAPVNGRMARDIEESLDAVVDFTLKNRKNGQILVQDNGSNAGFEMVGDLAKELGATPIVK